MKSHCSFSMCWSGNLFSSDSFLATGFFHFRHWSSHLHCVHHFFYCVFGRVFCGWACPQTIFMEMVFRKIEYWLDGDMNAQRRLKEMPWKAYKIRKRATKMAVFYFISFIIANFFLAYIIGMDDVLAMVKEGIGANPGTFISLLVFTTVFFFVYYWFRSRYALLFVLMEDCKEYCLIKNQLLLRMIM